MKRAQLVIDDGSDDDQDGLAFIELNATPLTFAPIHQSEEITYVPITSTTSRFNHSLSSTTGGLPVTLNDLLPKSGSGSNGSFSRRAGPPQRPSTSSFPDLSQPTTPRFDFLSRRQRVSHAALLGNQTRLDRPSTSTSAPFGSISHRPHQTRHLSRHGMSNSIMNSNNQSIPYPLPQSPRGISTHPMTPPASSAPPPSLPGLPVTSQLVSKLGVDVPSVDAISIADQRNLGDMSQSRYGSVKAIGNIFVLPNVKNTVEQVMTSQRVRLVPEAEESVDVTPFLDEATKATSRHDGGDDGNDDDGGSEGWGGINSLQSYKQNSKPYVLTPTRGGGEGGGRGGGRGRGD